MSPAPQPACRIQIEMYPDGSIRCQFAGPGRDVFNLMMARASQDMVREFMRQEDEAARQIIQVATTEDRARLVG